jgi:hypothetical protein
MYHKRSKCSTIRKRVYKLQSWEAKAAHLITYETMGIWANILNYQCFASIGWICCLNAFSKFLLNEVKLEGRAYIMITNLLAGPNTFVTCGDG